MDNFSSNVFINCPFDPGYRQLLISLIFTVKYLGFIPRLSLEKSDAGTARLENIVDIIGKSKFGIHDLSRLQAEKKGEFTRMNMPFELGIDIGCKKFKEGVWVSKKTLVLEKKRYRYMKALSDLSGSDICEHEDKPIKLVRIVRDWFITEELGTGPGSTKIWYDFNDFNEFLEEKLLETGHTRRDFNKTPIPEIMNYMDIWLNQEEIIIAEDLPQNND